MLERCKEVTIMFANLIYYDKNKVDQYKALILREAVDSKDIQQEDLQMRAAKYLVECAEFESLLKNREDYVDFVENDVNISVKDVKVASIIKVTGEIFVPESFDMVHLIDEYKPLLLETIDYNDAGEKELINKIFSSSKIKVPIFCELGEECDYWLGIGKAIQDNLLVEYNELEDLEGREFTIIAKLETRKYYKDTPMKVFDIYKDFLGLNRAFRKEIVNKNCQNFESIDIEEDYLGLELLAIY